MIEVLFQIAVDAAVLRLISAYGDIFVLLFHCAFMSSLIIEVLI